MRRLLMVAVVLVCSSTTYGWDTVKYRDSSGRTVGSASTRSGTTTFKDAAGRKVMTATTRSGKTTFRDSNGRFKGTATRKGK